MKTARAKYVFDLPCPGSPVASVQPIDGTYNDEILGRTEFVISNSSGTSESLNVQLSFEVSSGMGDDQIGAAVDRSLRHIGSVFTLLAGLVFEAPRHVEDTLRAARRILEPLPGVGGIEAAARISVTARGAAFAEAVLPVNLASVLEIRLKHSIVDPLLESYVAAVAIKEQTASFLLLYGMLLSLTDDNQKKADGAIKAARPETVFTKSPRYRDTEESDITRVRNELSHVRNGVSKHASVAEARTLQPVLRDIVRDLLRKELNL